MNDEQVRRRLMTTLSAAVRLGRAGALPDNVVAAELADLADLYLAAVAPLAMPSDVIAVDGPPSATFDRIVQDVRKLGHWMGPTEQYLRGMTDQEPPAPVSWCGFELVTYVYDGTGEVVHVHRCQKDAGHADGPGGSDHQCESCGVLYDADGGTAAPLGMAGLPLGGNGPTPDAEEIEL